jgi:hypothetical protein
MGTNRRSRRRSAARILNSTNNPKRQRISSSTISEDYNSDNFQQLDDIGPVTPDQSTQTGNMLSPSGHDHDNGTPLGPIYSPIEDMASQSEITITGPTTSTPVNTPKFTTAEICSYELMTLLDNAGCPLKTYEQVVALLKKQEKRGFLYSKAHSREKLLNLLRQKFHCPSIQSSIVNNCEVFSFPFVDMLQDLVDTAGSSLHMISPTRDNEILSSDELWNTPWMQQTFHQPLYANFNPCTDVMLPLILYLDKTGTDALQRYSLEPILFTVASLTRETRENRQFWRHLGFIPSSKNIEDSKESLQFYHHCLSFILTGLKHAQQHKPTIRVKQIDGSFSNFRAHLPLMIIMGDQLSQDTLCCRRKANSGGACRVHRSCMCSYLTTDDHTQKCQSVPKDLIDNIIAISNRTVVDMESIIDEENLIADKTSAKSLNSRTMKFFRKQRQLFNTLLSKPFTTHPVVSAFHDVDFGAWSSGVYEATFDDFMHSFEEGMMENIGTTIFDGLVADAFQINQAIYNSSHILDKRTLYPDSYPQFASIEGVYSDKGNKIRISSQLMNRIQAAMNPNTIEKSQSKKAKEAVAFS